MIDIHSTAAPNTPFTLKSLWRVDIVMIALLAFTLFGLPQLRHLEVVGTAHSAAPREASRITPAGQAYCSPRHQDCDPTDNAVLNDGAAPPAVPMP